MNEAVLSTFPTAAPWSLWTGELGKDLVIASLIAFIGATIFWLLPRFAAETDQAFENRNKISSGLFVAGCIFTLGTMGCLTALFVKDQFQYGYVFNHSGTSTSIAYKVASVWTAQQGSFLLWASTSALFGLLAIGATGTYRRIFGSAYAVFQACLCGILAYDSPFTLLKDVVAHGKVFVPPDGNGMVPSLQNYWVIIHPPTIFTGFGSLTVLFAYAVAAMLTKNGEKWVSQVRPYALVSMSILGLGLCMGGMWAYETQGWGGFWAWDPVENVSFVPWLFCTALAHGLIVQSTRQRWKAANLLLAGLPFVAFVYGTFLTRSGLLDKVSVHSFASMDKSALQVLRTFLVVLCIGFASLWIGTRKQFTSEPHPTNSARESFYRFGVLIISLFATVIALGMSWPVITALRGGQGSAVEERTYHLVVTWFFIPTMIAMAVAPFASWREMHRNELFARILNVVSVSTGLTGFLMFALTNPTFGVHLQGGENVATPFGTKFPLVPWMAILLFCCVFVATANIWRIAESIRRNKTTLGGFLAHLGFATLLAGLILSRGFEQKSQEYIQEGQPAHMLDYNVEYKRMEGKDLTDRDGKVIFNVTGPDGSHFEATPGLYWHQQGDEMKAQVWPDVHKSFTHDVYFSLHEPVMNVWDQPEVFHPGETRSIAGMTANPIQVHYDQMTTAGPLGQVGATFGANLKVTTEEGTFAVHPTLQLTDQGLEPHFAKVGSQFIATLSRMDPADHSVTVQLLFQHPVYPIELFYKPLTSLVWIGTGIFTVGGFLSAYSRRRLVNRSRLKPVTSSTPNSGFEPDHVSVPTA